MENLNNNTNKYLNRNLNDTLKRDYVVALKDENFKKITKRLGLSDEIGMKYTSKLEHTVNNLVNCEKCKHLCECKNEVEGCIYYPTINEELLYFNYVACKYKNKQIEIDKQNKAYVFGLSSDLKNAKMSDIDINDKDRIKVIKDIKKIFDEYPKNKKGIFLHGSFGCGKTYLISALLNELAKKNYSACMIYFPEMLNKLKSTFDKKYENMNELLDKVKMCDILLLDDLGAETVTEWSRDEILGTILQYRMENNLLTFITSNLNIEELENHLSLAKNSTDKVKARRIIERIKQLMNDIELVSFNRRN